VEIRKYHEATKGWHRGGTKISWHNKRWTNVMKTKISRPTKAGHRDKNKTILIIRTLFTPILKATRNKKVRSSIG